MRIPWKVLSGVLAAVAIFALVGAHSANLILNVGIGNAAALDMYGLGLGTMNKFGYNGDVDTTEESIWDADDLPTEGDGPIRCFTNVGTNPAAFYISSDHEDDAGLGVTVEGLDANWASTIISATLGDASASGTLFAQIGGANLLRINRMYATSTALTGNIYAGLDDTDGGTDGVPDTPVTDIIAVITAGENQTLQACYTVPLGYSYTLNQFCTANIFNAAGRAIKYRMRASIAGTVARTVELYTLPHGIYACTPHNPPRVFVEKTDVEITGISSGADAIAGATFDGILFPDSMF